MARVGRMCSICSRRDANVIDGDILRREQSYRAISRQYGVTRAALERHAANHLRDTIRQSEELKQMLSAETLTRELNRWNDETWSLLARAKQTGNLTIQLGAIRAGNQHIETFARIGAMTEFEQRLQALEQANGHSDGHDDGDE